jgi:LmbE family N-acetylglucosaminyl deacetylase
MRLKLLAVLAHPDDESLGFGGTLAKYAVESVETYLVTATRGERGLFGPGDERGDPAKVGRVREAELRAAAAVLGIREVCILAFRTGASIRSRPGLPFEPSFRTFGEFGLTSSSPSVRTEPTGTQTTLPYPNSRRPPPYAPPMLNTAFMMERREIRILLTVLQSCTTGRGEITSGRHQSAFRKLTSTVDGVERQAVFWPDWAVTTEIDTSAFWPIVCKAVCCHQTQMSIYERLEDLTEEQQRTLWGTQEFYRVYSLVSGGRELETDLSEGLR